MTPPNTRTLNGIDKRPLLVIGALVAAALGLWAYNRLSAPSLEGAWSNGATDNRIDFTFNPDGSGTWLIGSARLEYRYTFDQTHRPAWLDLNAAPDGRPVTIRGIAEFAPDGRLKIRMPFPRTPDVRPTEFVDNDVENTILLKRVESAS